MGEYTYTGDDEVKIGVLDEAFWSREELLAAQDAGWCGKLHAADELSGMLADPSTLYALPPETPREFGQGSPYPTRMVPFAIPFGVSWFPELEHHEVVVTVGVYEPRRNAWLPCPMTDAGKAHCKGVNAPGSFYFLAVGERYTRAGRGRTLFACAGCGKMFSLEADDLAEVRAANPNGTAGAVRLMAREEPAVSAT